MKRAKKIKKISWLDASTVHPFIADSTYNTGAMTKKELQIFKMMLTWSLKKTGATLAESKN